MGQTWCDWVTSLLAPTNWARAALEQNSTISRETTHHENWQPRYRCAYNIMRFRPEALRPYLSIGLPSVNKFETHKTWISTKTVFSYIWILVLFFSKKKRFHTFPQTIFDSLSEQSHCLQFKHVTIGEKLFFSLFLLWIFDAFLSSFSGKFAHFFHIFFRTQIA